MNNLSVIQKTCSIFNQFSITFLRFYSKPIVPKLAKKKAGGKLGPIAEKKVLPVETDPYKLVNYVCGSNIYKTGEDVKIQPDSEYPDWLWTIRTGKPPKLTELDPNTKEYWRRIRKLALQRNNKLAKLKRF